jgi:hypothetical protein
MIDFDVVTGPGPSEKPREPASKPAPPAPERRAAEAVPRATLLPHMPVARPTEGAKSRP